MFYTGEKDNRLKVRGLLILAGLALVTLSLAFGIISLADKSLVSSIPARDNEFPIANTPLPISDGSVSANGATRPEEVYFYTTPAVVGAFSVDTDRPDSEAVTLFSSAKATYPVLSPHTTTASISARKAMEFTLVGAKPSGTS
jgi:hypothetical protein